MEGAFFKSKKDIIKSKIKFLDNKVRELDAALLFVSFILFALFAFFINRGIPIKALYMDDLYMWSWYAESDIIKFLTEDITERYRPVFWFFSYIECALVGNNPIGFYITNVVLNSLIAVFVYYFAKKLCNNFFIAFASGILYLVSHFSYYQIGQMLGILESLCMFFSLLFLFFVIKYLNCEIKEKSNAYFCVIIVVYILASYTHERFMGLLPVFLVALFFKNKVRISTKFIKTFICLLVLAGILFIRSYYTGSAVPAGTGGTQVTETFSIEQAIRFAFLQVLHIFGFTYGEEYLCGITFNGLDDIAKTFVYTNIVLIAIIELLYLMVALSHSYKTSVTDIDKPFPRVGMDLVFLTFIGMNIIASSPTIRLELRWVYTSMTGFILFAVFKISEICRLVNKTSVKRIMYLIFIFWFISRLFVDMSYRKGYNQIYCIKDQLKMNSLAEETVYKNGYDKIKNSHVYILDANFKLSDFYASWFFRVFAPNKTDSVPKIEHVYSNDLARLESDTNKIVLKEKDEFTYETVK